MPRYYDARKERLEKLMKETEKRTNKEYIKGYRRKTFREDWKSERKVSTSINTKLRFLIIVAFLCMFAWVALKYINFNNL